MDFTALLFRILHIGPAIVLLGGTVFVRYVLMPAAAELSEEEHERFRERVMAKWRLIVAGGILLLIISGFYNYLIVMKPAHEGDKQYDMLMGIKMLLAFVAFFLASVLTGRSAAFEWMRRAGRTWLVTLIVITAIVAGMGSYLKVRGTPDAVIPVEIDVEVE